MIGILIRNAWPLFWIAVAATVLAAFFFLAWAAIGTIERGSYEGWHRAGAGRTDRWDPDGTVPTGHIRPIAADPDTEPKHRRVSEPKHGASAAEHGGSDRERSLPGALRDERGQGDVGLHPDSCPTGCISSDQAGDPNRVHAFAALLLALPDLAPAAAPPVSPQLLEARDELYPLAPVIASLSDTDVWPAIRFELGRIRGAADEPFWLPSW